LARPNHNPKRRTVRIFNSDGSFHSWIEPSERDELLTNAELYELFEDRPGGIRHFVGYTREKPHGQSNQNSPASITHSDILANIGLSRFRPDGVSEGRRLGARAKVREFGLRESWAYKTMSVNGLTQRQRELVDVAMRNGKTARQAAVQLSLTKSFVDAYVKEKHSQ